MQGPPLEREFYIRMTRKFGWSKSVLIHQIENQSYEKTYRIVRRLPRELQGQLPSPQQIGRLLEGLG